MRIAVTILSVISKPDGTTRQVFQVFYKGDLQSKVVLESGEVTILTLQGSTALASWLDAREEPSSDDLKKDVLEILDMFLRREFVDISDKLK